MKKVTIKLRPRATPVAATPIVGSDSPVEAPSKFTLTDVDVALRIFEALVQQAQSTRGTPIGYSDLLTLARLLYPKDATLGRAVPVGIGMKLLFIEEFCKANGYPNLACLAVNPSAMRPPAGYAGDWEADRIAVAGFDWSVVQPQLADYATKERARVPKRLKPRKERPADVAWYAYFCSHREACANVGANEKTEIINLLMAGLDPETALGLVLAAKAEFGDAVYLQT